MNFSKLFLKKHGEEVFNGISKQIIKEKPNNGNNDYIEIVFKVAFLDFWGLKDWQIENAIRDSIKCNGINIENIHSIHRESIIEIQSYLQFAINETLN